MTARQFVLKEPAAIFFIPKLLNSYGHYTMVTSLGVLSKGRIAQAKASVNSQQNDSAGLMELRDLLSHEVVPAPCSPVRCSPPQPTPQTSSTSTILFVWSPAVRANAKNRRRMFAPRRPPVLADL